MAPVGCFWQAKAACDLLLAFSSRIGNLQGIVLRNSKGVLERWAGGMKLQVTCDMILSSKLCRNFFTLPGTPYSLIRTRKSVMSYSRTKNGRKAVACDLLLFS